MHHRSSFVRAFAAALSVVLVAATASADVVQPASDSVLDFTSTVVIGQSFTADPSIAMLQSIGFDYFVNLNPLPSELNGDTNVVIDLFTGLGYGGTLLDSAFAVIPESQPRGFFDLDFTGNSLIPGQTYSFRITAGPGTGGIAYTFDDLYAGGFALSSSGTGSPASGDLAFRVIGEPSDIDPVIVPSPAAVGAGLALLSLLGVSRRRRG